MDGQRNQALTPTRHQPGRYMAIFSGSAFSVKVAYMAYFGRVHGRSDNQRKMGLRPDKEEVPGSSPGRPTLRKSSICRKNAGKKMRS